MLIPTSDNTKNITDLRENTLKLLKDVDRLGTVYIMQRSYPKAVILSIDEFQRMQELIEDHIDELDAEELSKEPLGKLIPHSEIVKKYAKKNL